jgi:hypothetical protein
MPTATIDAPKSETKGERLFIVKIPMTGFLNIGHVFSESQFASVYRCKGVTEEHQARIDAQINAKTFHNQELEKRLALGVIEPAPPGSTAMEIPMSPGFRDGLSDNRGTAISTEEILRYRKNRLIVAQSDARDVRAGVRPQPGPTNEPDAPVVNGPPPRSEVRPVHRAAGSA